MSNELRCLTSISKLKYVCITDSITSKKESSKKIASLTSSLLDAKFPKIKQTRTTNSCKIIIKETNIMEHCIRLAIHLAPVVRASDISRKKKAKFCGIFTGKFAEKLADFAGFSREKSQNSQKNWQISRDFSRKKTNFEGFSRANSQKNWPISRDFRGKKSNFEGFSGANS